MSNIDSNSTTIAQQQQDAKDGFSNKEFDRNRTQNNESSVDSNRHQEKDMTLDKDVKDTVISSGSEIKQAAQSQQPIIN
ncbi:ATP-binding cassette transporter CGR1 [Acrasis kona]|uniref:ATP-binding cassette transporter CGR1 n=1 Tax=Acrasis kona TaxID=1008807 RepID=A0AAW2ZNC6_9EUKA